MNDNLSSTKILDVPVTTALKDDILKYIFKRLEKSREKFYIVTPNPEILIYAKNHPSFKTILNNAKVSLPDGVGVLMAGKMLKKKIIGRITGVDFMDEICREASKRHVIVGFLGGRGNVAEKTAERLSGKYPGLKVGFAGEEFPEVLSSLPSHSTSSSSTAGDQWDALSARHPNLKKTSKIFNSQSSTLKFSRIDILFVAFGFPKQEEWIYENLPKIDVKMAMGVGGAFDFIAGKVSRAPVWVQKVGMEWAYRLGKEPWRVKRQLALPKFIFEVLKEKVKG